MHGHGVVVVGASAGGVEALRLLAAGLPADLPAAVFVVLHVPPHCASALPAILTRSGALAAIHAEHGERVEPGRVYVAPPDHHLLVGRGRVWLGRGPRESGHRPAVDTLFRSAAEAYDARVIGVVLSGALHDGTAGLAMIKRLGGLALVQDPAEALSPGMPQSAIDNVAVDEVLGISGIAKALIRLTKHEAPQRPPRAAADQ